VVSLDLSEQFKNIITTTIFNDDIVPRLSFGSISDLKFLMNDIIDFNDSNTNLKRFFHTLAQGNNLGTNLTKKIATWLDCPPQPNWSLLKRCPLSERLWPPGIILLIKKKGVERHIELSNASLFMDVIISSSMFVDHLPFEYQENFKTAMQYDFPTELENSTDKGIVEVEPLLNKSMEPLESFAQFEVQSTPPTINQVT